MHASVDPLSPRVTAPFGAGYADLALALGGLAIGTGEFASMSILPVVADDLGTNLVISEVFGHIAGIVACTLMGSLILCMWWWLPLHLKHSRKI